MTIDEIMGKFWDNQGRVKSLVVPEESSQSIVSNPDKVIHLRDDVGMYWVDEPDVSGRCDYGMFVRLMAEGEWVFQDHRLILSDEGVERIEWL